MFFIIPSVAASQLSSDPASSLCLSGARLDLFRPALSALLLLLLLLLLLVFTELLPGFLSALLPTSQSETVSLISLVAVAVVVVVVVDVVVVVSSS